MENPLVMSLKKFSATVIQLEKLSPPVQVKLMDVGTNAVYEMECSEIVEGFTFSRKSDWYREPWRGPVPTRWNSRRPERLSEGISRVDSQQHNSIP
jgi:hypothetical protein